MSLVIGRLQTRAVLPRTSTHLASVVERVARGPLARAFASELPELPRTYGRICRIRRLHVHVRLSAKDLNDETLLNRWAQVFRRDLIATLGGRADGNDVIVAESRGKWVGSYLARRLSGQARDAWAFAEFAATDALPVDECAASVIEASPKDAPDVLAFLAGDGSCTRLLLAMSDAQAARVCGVISRLEAKSDAVSPSQLIRIGELALAARRVPGRGELTSPLRALAVYAHQFEHSPTAGRVESIGDILVTLRALDRICALHQICALDEVRSKEAFGAVLSPILSSLCQASADSLRELFSTAASARHAGEGTPSPAALAIAGLAEQLRDAIPASGVSLARDVSGQWIDSAVAGLLLLLPIVARERWCERIAAHAVTAEHGPRALTSVLAGAALAITGGETANIEQIDRAQALFAGWTDAPHVAGYRHFVAHVDSELRRSLLGALLPDEDAAAIATAAASWSTMCGHLARRLVRAFAARIRGFGQSTDDFIIRSFLMQPGRLLIERDCVRVVLRPNPLWVVVHLSGADTAVDHVRWLDDRPVTFVLEGL
jgi:hypothetical protein